MKNEQKIRDEDLADAFEKSPEETMKRNELIKQMKAPVSKQAGNICAGDICKMITDVQYDYRKIAWADVTVYVENIDGDKVLVSHDNDVFP